MPRRPKTPAVSSLRAAPGWRRGARIPASGTWSSTSRCRYYAFEDWASTPRESDAGRFVIPAKTVFKTHCDHTFGGCPAEFVDARNASNSYTTMAQPCLDARRENDTGGENFKCDVSFPAGNRPPVARRGPCPRLRDLPDTVHDRPSFKKRRARLLLHQAVRLADASTLGDDERAGRLIAAHSGESRPPPPSRAPGGCGTQATGTPSRGVEAAA